MTAAELIKNTQHVLKENSPSILAALAVGGVVTTGLAAYSFGHRYGYEEAMLEETQSVRLTGKEKVERYWRPVVPVLLVASGTIFCVVASTVVSNRRNAALGGLVALGEVTLREYKDKVREVVTKDKAERVERELAQDKLDRQDSNEVVFVGDGDILMFDVLTSRTFKSSKLAVERAEVEIGRRLLSDMYISQNEWYDEIGLPRVAMGDDQGWNHDMPLEVKFVALIKDEKPVIGVDYKFHPSITFNRFG